MKIKPRNQGSEVRGLCLVAETKEESRMIDECFGSKVDDDGLIATGSIEVRLSDGYGEHYIYAKR